VRGIILQREEKERKEMEKENRKKKHREEWEKVTELEERSQK
jgi:hypothetical protein